MTGQKSKYSLWLIPTGEAGEILQSLVNRLAKQYNAPVFVPHLTLVANILADSTEMQDIKQKITGLAASIDTFSLSMTTFGFKDEAFRCLYLLAESPELDAVYAQTASIFPPANNEHFRSMPHLSVLYGMYPLETKEQIIRDNQLPPIECPIKSFDLYLTNKPISSWKEVDTFLLS